MRSRRLSTRHRQPRRSTSPSIAVEDGNPDAVDLPDLSCPNCGTEFDNWYTDVKQERILVTLLVPHNIPSEIQGLPEDPDHASFIEYFRADCSRYLVHLTKPGRVSFGFDNVVYEKVERDFTAAEVLWAILISSTIQARRGKGMRRPAVCLTEKPLPALKDSLVGHEASRRRGRAISWSPYGVMFDKSYAMRKGVAPVLPCSPADANTIPEESQFRITPLSHNSNWLHEREWRCATDLKFDLSEAVVLVPNWEQAEAFRSALTQRGQHARGFLPLFDLFAFV
jgi:hypothetical protein